MSVPKITLNDGNKIPQVGLGTWQVKDQAEFDTAFSSAIKAGYRHFDTAQAYGNETYLGDAIKRQNIKRESIFITTKIAVQHFGSKKLKESFHKSLSKLSTDYVDLLLLHFPVTLLRNHAWHDLEEIKATGSAKSIGVSNYTIRHLEELKTYAKITPAVNQVELHVFLQQPELIKYCREQNIVVEAYSPIARAKELDNPVILEIAKKHNKTYVQIMLRFLIEHGLVILPKSVNKTRVFENINLFDFNLDEADMATLSALDKNMRVCWSPVHVP
jgi:diketogulonate reductase-like aldo/keto reductase